MTLAVLVPYREPSAELNWTVRGLRAQSEVGTDVELVFIHNGASNCGLGPVTDMPFRVYHRCIGHQRPAYSLASARNLGLLLTQASWVLCLDADCVPARSHIASLARVIESANNLIVAGERRFVDTREADPSADIGQLLATLPRVRSRSNHGRSVDVRFPYLRNPIDSPHPWDLMHGGNVAFRRDVALEVGGFDEEFDGHWGFEDAEFAYRMVQRGGAVPTFEPNAVVYHQESGDDLASHDRGSRETNPNWHRACNLIPGFETFKAARRREIYGREG